MKATTRINRSAALLALIAGGLACSGGCQKNAEKSKPAETAPKAAAGSPTSPHAAPSGSSHAASDPHATNPHAAANPHGVNPHGTAGGGTTEGVRRVQFGIMPDYNDGNDGVLAESVTPDTPADEAGVQPGDRLLTWNGRKVEDVQMWSDLLKEANPGDIVEVTLKRGDQTLTKKVKLKARPTE